METAEESILDENCYLQVIKKKTATLLSACTEIGAISSGASAEVIALCREFGEYLGYCFQIKDDIFDYFKEANIGKRREMTFVRVRLRFHYYMPCGRVGKRRPPLVWI